MKLTKWGKRGVLFLLSAMLVCGTASCGNGPSSSANSSSANNSTPSSSSGESGAKKLSIAIGQNVNVEDYETNDLTKWLEEDLNVDL